MLSRQKENVPRENQGKLRTGELLLKDISICQALTEIRQPFLVYYLQFDKSLLITRLLYTEALARPLPALRVHI